LPSFSQLDADRQGVITEMVFQLSLDGVLDFHDMIDALEKGD